MERTSASGHLRLARLVRLRTLGVTNAERASSTAICTRSAQVTPMHMPSSWASRASSRSDAPMSRSLRFASTERSIALRLPAGVGAAHVAGLVLARAAVVRERSGDQALAGLEGGPEVPVPGRGRAARERHRARPLQPRPRVAALEPEHGEGRVEAPPLAVDALEDAAHHLPAGRPGAVGPAPDAARVPAGARPPLGEVAGMSRVAVPRERREERVRRQPLAGEEDPRGGVGDPQVDRPADR